MRIGTLNVRRMSGLIAILLFAFASNVAKAETNFTFRQPLNLKCGVPGTIKACPIPNGTGQLVCNEQGSAGPCVLVSCDATYHAVSGVCVSDTQSCVPGNGSAGQQGWTGSGWGVCVASACNAGYHVEGGACLPDTRACTVANAAAASQSWTGAGYTACAATACVSGYHVAAGACVADVQGCPVANGTGSQTWAGSGWGTCSVVSCNSGYHAAAGACISNAQSCSIANGAGSQTWTGSAWGACTVTGCDGGYYVSGNGCAAYSYAWQAGGWSGCSASPWWGDWGGCSANCGGGTQSRSCNGTDGSQSRGVWCQRNDGASVADAFCGGGKPTTSQSCSSSCSGASSQSCNTQSCAPMPYINWSVSGSGQCLRLRLDTNVSLSGTQTYYGNCAYGNGTSFGWSIGAGTPAYDAVFCDDGQRRGCTQHLCTSGCNGAGCTSNCVDFDWHY